MQTIKIACDTCDNDLTLTRHNCDWRLSLKNEQIAFDPEATKLSGIGYHPILKGIKHFCDLNCLVQWVDKQREMVKVEQEKDSKAEAEAQERKIVR